MDGPGLEPAGHEADGILPRIEAVEHVEVAFAGDGKDVLDALGHEGVGQDAAAGAGGDGHVHGAASCVWRQLMRWRRAVQMGGGVPG